MASRLTHSHSGFKDVTANIDSLVDQAGNKITLKNSVNLAEQALTDSDETATIAVADSTSEVVSGTDAKTFKFNYAPTTAEETHWYVIAEPARRNGGRRVRHHGLSCEDHHERCLKTAVA